jgi:hypothetical protein
VEPHEERKRLRLCVNKGPSIFCWKIMSDDQSAECIGILRGGEKIDCVGWKSDEINALGSTGFKQAVECQTASIKEPIQNSNTPKRFTKSFW